MPEMPALPTVADQPISVILLAHDDEAPAVEATRSWISVLDTLKRPYEIVVVDLSSTGQTAGRIRDAAESLPNVRSACPAQSRGAGAALREVLPSLLHPLLCLSPCDSRYDPADLRALLNEIDKVHIASGFRRYNTVPVLLRALGALFRLAMRVLFGFAPEPLPGWLGWRAFGRRLMARIFFAVRLRDVECALRLYRRSIFDNIPLQSKGVFVHVEILAKANFLGCYMNDEVMVTYRPQPGREGRPQGWWADFWRVLQHPTFGAVAPLAPTPALATPDAQNVPPEPPAPVSDTTEGEHPPCLG